MNPLTDSLSENSGPVTESRVRRFHLWSLDRNVAMVPVATLESCAQVHCAAISTDNAWLGVGAGIKYGTRKNRNQIRRFAGGAGGSSRQRSRGSSDGDE